MVDLAKIYTAGENILTSRQNRALNRQALDPNSPQNALAMQKMDLERQKFQQGQQKYTEEQLAGNTEFAIKAFSQMANNPYTAKIYTPELVKRGILPESAMQYLGPENYDKIRQHSTAQLEANTKAMQAYLNSKRESKLLTPEEMAQKQAIAQSGKSEININTGDIPLTKTQESKNQQAMIDAQSNIERLRSIGGSYADKFLTYEGRIKGAWSGLKEKAGFNLSSQDKEFLTDFTKFTTRVKRFFNAYRKEITGAAAAVQELEQLKQSVINGDMSPTEFKAAFESLMDGFDSELSRYYGYATSGIPKEIPDTRNQMQQQPIQQQENVIDWSEF